MKTIICLLFSLLVAQTLGAAFSVRFYSGNDECEGTPDVLVTARDDGDCYTSKKSEDGGSVKIFPLDDNEGWTVVAFLDNTCVLPVMTQDMGQLDLATCLDYNIIFSKNSFFVNRAIYSCFPEDSTVTLANGESKLIQDLAIGDSVQTRHGFSEVYAFLDRRPDVFELFEKFTYLDQNDVEKTIRMTPEHLVLAKRGEATTETFVLAEEVQVGDYIYIQAGDKTSPVIVSKKETVTARGLYTPATLDGTIIVDGVVASSYAVVSQEISHAVLAPLRFVHQYFPSFMQNQETGLHPYASMLYSTLSSWLEEKNAFYSAPQLSAASH